MKGAQPKILCLFSAPLVDPNGKAIESLDIQAEKEAIIRELSDSEREIVIRIGYATVDELDRGIKDKFNILHLSGHGSEEHLLFEDGKSGCQLINGKYLNKLVGTGGPFELAIINACHSEQTGKCLHEAGVKHVITIKRETPTLIKQL